MRRALLRARLVRERGPASGVARAGRPARMLAPAELWRSYDLLQAWDELSLAFLTDSADDRAIGPPPARAGRAPSLPLLRLRRSAPGDVVLTPWPFVAERVELPVRARFVADRRYRDGDDFAAALAAAPEGTLNCALVAR
jgi:hypothetical protein